MIITPKFNQTSDALKSLMDQHAKKLRAQRDMEPHGTCGDCHQPIPRHELFVCCKSCLNEVLVCIRCIDMHEQVHRAFGVAA